MNNIKNFDFKPASTHDIKRIESWYHHINGEKFLSHYIPSSLLSENKSFTGILQWFIIIAEGYEIGTIWLEQKDITIKELDIGIFLNDDNLMGKGIGGSIIKQFINNQGDLLKEFSICLNVRISNLRAIRCYQKTGFKIIDTRQKRSGIEIIDYYRMKLQNVGKEIKI